jgi:predicted transcriptional regulator
MKRLTVRIPAELRLDLEKLSREKQRPLSELAREAIRRYVALERFRELRRKIIPFAKANGFHRDEDVFNAVS